MNKARLTLDFAVELRYDCQSYLTHVIFILNIEQEAPFHHVVS